MLKVKSAKLALVSLFLICIGLTSISTVLNFFDHGMRINPDLEDVSDFLLSNGYTQGYATFWNGDVLIEWSNGAIEVWVTDDFNSLRPYQWSQTQSHVNPPQGEIFLLTTLNELNWLHLETIVDFGNVVFEKYSKQINDSYIVLCYADHKELLDNRIG